MSLSFQFVQRQHRVRKRYGTKWDSCCPAEQAVSCWSRRTMMDKLPENPTQMQHELELMVETWPVWQLTTSALPVHLAALLQRASDTNTSCTELLYFYFDNSIQLPVFQIPSYASLPLFLMWMFLTSFSPFSIFFCSILSSPSPPCTHLLIQGRNYRKIISFDKYPYSCGCSSYAAVPSSLRALMFVALCMPRNPP